MNVILLSSLFDTFSWSFIIPALPLLQERHAIPNSVVGVVMATTSTMSLIVNPILCRASDKYGRLPFLILSAAGTLIGLLISILAKNPSIYIAGRILPFFVKCGMGVPYAYIADVSGAQSTSLAVNIGRLNAVLALGLIVGPLLGGLLSAYDPLAPFCLAAISTLSSILFLSLTLMFQSPATASSGCPENTMKKKQQQKEPIQFPASNIFTAFSLASVYHIKFAFQISVGIFELFLVSHVRDQLELKDGSFGGLVVSFYGIVSLLCNSMLIPLLSSSTVFSAMSVSAAALLALMNSAGLLLWGHTHSTANMLFSIFTISVTSSLFTNVMQTLVSERGDGTKMGATMGTSAMVDRAARIVAPIVAGFTKQDKNSPVSIGVAASFFAAYSAGVIIVSSISSSNSDSNSKLKSI